MSGRPVRQEAITEFVMHFFDANLELIPEEENIVHELEKGPIRTEDIKLITSLVASIIDRAREDARKKAVRAVEEALK